MRQLANSHTDYGRSIDLSSPEFATFGSFTQVSFPTLMQLLEIFQEPMLNLF